MLLSACTVLDLGPLPHVLGGQSRDAGGLRENGRRWSLPPFAQIAPMVRAKSDSKSQTTPLYSWDTFGEQERERVIYGGTSRYGSKSRLSKMANLLFQPGLLAER